MSQENNSTLLVHYDGPTPNAKELREAVEKGDIPTKIDTVRRIIRLHLSGEPMNHLVMPIIKFCVPSEDHTLKKLLLYFWETIEKTDNQGKLLPEMILFVNFLRNDLKHPNEYIRGMTLRFLCKLKEGEIIESLVPCIIDCLEHRHSYVRRSAVMACHSIYSRFPQMMSDAPEHVAKVLESETDICTRRNAFVMLFHCAPQRAVSYLRKSYDSIEPQQVNDAFNLALVDLLKQLIISDPQDKSQYVRIVFQLLQSQSPSLLYQCASTLLSLSSSPTALRQAVQTFTQLLNSSSDNNVKLIILDRLASLKKTCPEVLQENLVDLLRALSTTNTDIRRKVLDLSGLLITAKNIESFIQYMKKELVRTGGETESGTNSSEYQELIVKALHTAVIQHMSVAPSVIPVVLDYITDDSAAAADIMLLIREVMVRAPSMREEILTKLSVVFASISSTKVLRTCLWIFGTHCGTLDEITNIFATVKKSMEPFPLEISAAALPPSKGDSGTVTSATTSVREDGTYVMNITTVDKRAEPERTESTLRTAITEGDFFLASVLCNAVAKLIVQLFQLQAPTQLRNEMQVNATELMREVVRFGQSSTLDDDSYERIKYCMAVVAHPKAEFLQKIMSKCKTSFQELLASQEAAAMEKLEVKVTVVPADQAIFFSQLSKNSGNGAGLIEDEDILVATSNDALDEEKPDFVKTLARVLQLTGFGDPVYAEANVTVHQYDILVEMLVVNQTNDTFENLTVEFATIGDLKLCERPQNFTVAPHAAVTIRASIKVSGTETAVIFGNIVYDVAGSMDRYCVVLNDIHVDIMDYITPATCSAIQFRSMWAEYEWENKVQVSTNITDPAEFIESLVRHTNLTCLMKGTAAAEDYDFMAVNLYAKTIFGEDALANVSLERSGPEGKLEGYIRLRSATQGIALSLGDKIAMKQKEA